MSFATWNFLKVYARWRDAVLRIRKTREPIDWRPPEPIITLGEKGEKIKNMGILVVLGLVLLAWASDSK